MKFHLIIILRRCRLRMQTPVSLQDKKGFIQWFLNHYLLKKRESVWILNYLINHNEVLSNVHFIRHAKYCPRGIIITSHCSEEDPFLFYKNNIMTTDADKAFHDIRINKNEQLYIQLNFKKANQCPSYVAVLESNPYIFEEHFINEEDQIIAKRLLEKLTFNYKRKSLRLEIDRSLDEKDPEKFKKLVEILHRLEKNKSVQPKSLKQ